MKCLITNNGLRKIEWEKKSTNGTMGLYVYYYKKKGDLGQKIWDAIFRSQIDTELTRS